MTARVRILAAVLATAVAAAVLGPVARPDDGLLRSPDGDTVEVTDAARARSFAFDPTVVPAQRAWIEAALAAARPEAARLIAEVDGLTTIAVFDQAGPGRQPLGVASGGAEGFRVELNATRLDGDKALDRATVVLHELGHVVDFALVPAAMGAQLDAGIPPTADCREIVNCDDPTERFADTFAKWALGGAVSAVGAGYGIATPPSLEDWGAPLGRLSFELVAARE